MPVVTGSLTAVLLLPASAWALSCAARTFTLEEGYEAADGIIVALVTECAQEVSSDPWASGGADCAFVSLDVLKEAAPTRDYSGVASSSGCGLALHVGSQYLLFLDAENRPMHFSAALTDDPGPAQQTNSYVTILRAFRDGGIRDLAEPWLVGETDAGCWLSHNVGRHQFRFSRRNKDALDTSDDAAWTRETVDGKTVYRGHASAETGSSVLPGEVTVTVAAAELPDHLPGAQALSVSLPEREPAPPRRATLRVGTRSWPLYRTETTIALQDMPPVTNIDYRAVGEAAEQILAAMTEPSDIVVTAVLVPGTEDESAAGPHEDYLGSTSPDAGFAEPPGRPDGTSARPRRARGDPPDTVLRLETRSTQLSAVIDEYRACYEGFQR